MVQQFDKIFCIMFYILKGNWFPKSTLTDATKLYKSRDGQKTEDGYMSLVDATRCIYKWRENRSCRSDIKSHRTEAIQHGHRNLYTWFLEVRHNTNPCSTVNHYCPLSIDKPYSYHLTERCYQGIQQATSEKDQIGCPKVLCHNRFARAVCLFR